jgi:hypothetical protein
MVGSGDLLDDGGMNTAPTHNLSVHELVARTPVTRNRYIDLLRVFSIFVVVVGHWLMAVITIDATGAIQGDNILGLVPWMQYLTWGLQVMPIFFGTFLWLRLSPRASADRRPRYSGASRLCPGR